MKSITITVPFWVVTVPLVGVQILGWERTIVTAILDISLMKMELHARISTSVPKIQIIVSAKMLSQLAIINLELSS